MSLQELKTHLIEQISQTDDANALAELSYTLHELLIPAVPDALASEAELAAAQAGRAQIAAGHFKTADEAFAYLEQKAAERATMRK